jgi:type I site-specific restriction-modification system R (restriction) subunit
MIDSGPSSALVVGEILASNGFGGIVFSTMQKFELTKRIVTPVVGFPWCPIGQNIVVIADEAHRMQRLDRWTGAQPT